VGDDREPPQLQLRRGTHRSVLLNNKIEIDASTSTDNQEIARVWWEVRGKIVLDSDTTEYEPLEILKILLPAESRIGTSSVVLHAVDVSGNESELSITVDVKAPELKLQEASARDSRISGKVISGEEGVEVWFIREREGRQEMLSSSVVSQQDGAFVLEDMSRTGGVFLRDEKTNEARAEVLETGRPILLDDSLVQSVQSANNKNPLQIALKENTGENSATITFVAPKKKKITIPIEEKLLEKVSWTDIQISDGEKDFISWREGTNGIIELWDEENEKIVGTIDQRGQFQSFSPDVYLRIQAAIREEDPIVFEVWKEKRILAQFSMPVPEKITVQEQNVRIINK
jgi:hypothetical protein